METEIVYDDRAAEMAAAAMFKETDGVQFGQEAPGDRERIVMTDPKIIVSPFSQPFSEGGITVDVQIYKIEGAEGWMLELVDEKNNSTVWTDPFPSDQAAWDEFVTGVRELGLKALLEADETEGATVH
jgi:hypothetical protein